MDVRLAANLGKFSARVDACFDDLPLTFQQS
jgi:hypothetical protein